MMCLETLFQIHVKAFHDERQIRGITTIVDSHVGMTKSTVKNTFSPKFIQKGPILPPNSFLIPLPYDSLGCHVGTWLCREFHSLRWHGCFSTSALSRKLVGWLGLSWWLWAGSQASRMWGGLVDVCWVECGCSSFVTLVPSSPHL